MVDIQRLGIEVAEDAPIFRDDNSILNYAAEETEKQIAKWDGVQIKECKKIDKHGTKILESRAQFYDNLYNQTKATQEFISQGQTIDISYGIKYHPPPAVLTVKYMF